MEEVRTVSTIQEMISPAIMISVCGLLFLGLQNRYGRIIDRLRGFNQRKRELLAAGPSSAANVEMKRIESQIRSLLRRGAIERTAIAGIFLAVICFVLTSLLIVFLPPPHPLASFIAGLFFLLLATVAAWFEVAISYQIVRRDTRDLEKAGFRE